MYDTTDVTIAITTYKSCHIVLLVSLPDITVSNKITQFKTYESNILFIM